MAVIAANALFGNCSKSQIQNASQIAKAVFNVRIPIPPVMMFHAVSLHFQPIDNFLPYCHVSLCCI